ncbi:tyrosine-protein phosphatase Lar-like isoform X3 [Paramacrobiotus metropolitanus]|uniref:tyrosine-protein phosphatase Lar-like isoform X3 n=1 Tax=Paramacrobiotus metropolitanus TaxID=2943436 RepID=UPI002445938D|nr:tyrosine-protein phosphatase Lar-like isoform X3 [Paramacrobiotus metropolitanus]
MLRSLTLRLICIIYFQVLTTEAEGMLCLSVHAAWRSTPISGCGPGCTLTGGIYGKNAPQILNPPVDTTAIHGRAVSFICRASGNPKPRIIWQKNGKRAASSRILIKDVPGGSASVLRIDPVRQNRDDAVYTCLAENGIGTPVTASAKLTVLKDDEAPAGFPKIIHHPQLKSVEKGGNAVMFCQVDGNPPPEVIWLKDNIPLELDSSRYTLLDQGSLQIRQTVEQDEGDYECLAKNVHGTLQSNSAKLYVKVRRVPPYFSIPFSQQYSVPLGSDLNVTCVAAGAPVPFVKWREGLRDVAPGAGEPQAIGKVVLQLKNIRKSGNFTCVASAESNMQDPGAIEASTWINVDGVADRPRADASSAGLPLPPRNLKISDVTGSSVNLSWYPGGDNEQIKYYVVQYKPRDSAQGYSEISGITTTSHTVTNLKPYTLYEFQVVCVNDKGRGPPSDVAEMTTLEAEPGSAPRNVRARAPSSTSLFVEWDPPMSPNGQIVGYKVAYTTDARLSVTSWRFEMVGNELSTTLSNLQPRAMYTVRIQAYTSGGPGPFSRPIQIKTQHGIPGQVTDVTFPSVSTDSVRVKWTAPASTGHPITSYKIYYNSSDGAHGHETVEASTTDTTIRMLRPSTEYFFYITASSSAGESPASDALKVMTKQSRPVAPPQALAGKYLDSRRIEITWLPPEQDTPRGRIISYKIFYQPSDQEQGEPMVVTAEGESRRYILRDLSTWTEYKIWMVASTAVGDGPPTEPIIVRTDESVPERPRKVGVTVKNATSIDVEWLPPSQKGQNGIIRGYLIFIQPVDERDELIDDTYKYNIMDGTATHYTVTNLKPDTNYNVQVGAYTRSGDGELTKPKKVKTPPGLPLSPKLDEPKLSEDQGKVQVKLHWKKPEQTYGALKGYYVMYGKKGSPKEQFTVKEMLPGDEFISIEGLGRGVPYEFRVAAFNNLGVGVEAIKEVQMPEGVPTGPPQNISYRFDSPSAVHITWDPPVPDMQNGLITGYTVYFDANGTIAKTNVTQPFFDFDKLELRKEYIFRISAWTKKGEGKISQNIVISTPAEVPPPPENVRAAAINDTHAEVRWNAIPDTPAIKIYGYKVSFSCVKEVRHLCTHAGSVDVDHATSVILPNMETGRNYTVIVAGKTTRSVGQSSKKVVFRMAPEEVPKDVHVVNVLKDSITIRWKPPLVVIPSRYMISWRGRKVFLDQDGSTQIRQMPKGSNETANTEITLNNLRPHTTYYIDLTAIPLDGREPPAVRLEVKTAIDVPPMLFPPNFTTVTKKEMIRIQLKRATEEFGPIKHYLVVVVPSQLAIKHPDNYTLAELTRHELASGQQTHRTVKPSFPYIAAKFSRENLPHTFDVGDGNVYETYLNRQIVPGQHYRVFVRAYVDSQNISEPLYTSSPFSEDISTDKRAKPEIPEATQKAAQFPWWIILVAGFILAVIIGLIILFFVKRNKKTRKPIPEPHVKPPQPSPTYAQKPTTNGNGAIGNGHGGHALQVNTSPETKALLGSTYPEEPEPSPNSTLRLREVGRDKRDSYPSPQPGRHPAIPIEDLANYINNLKANDNLKFSQEYESVETNQQFTWENSNLEYNKPKNRYANVVAYDHSRVILKTLDGIPGSDYINANFCDGYRHKNMYIATQGPLPETFGDFWRMVWEQNCFTIIMMTKLEERARIKCDQYWPSRGHEQYGVMLVTLVDVQEMAFYCVRTFHLQPMGHMDRREVRQYQFTGWPDHGVPESPTQFLMFLRRVKTGNPPEAGPLVVHCSAGVGRTGAFIVIEAQLDRLQSERSVDVYGHVTCLREQRNYMVQTEDQYIFIYDAVLEAVEAGFTEVRAGNLHQRLQKLMQPVGGPESITAMELEFRKLAPVKAEMSKFVSANMPVNKHKNRLINILPYESSRVCLEPIRSIDGSDYINASYIDSYRQRSAYIATQAPLKSTVDDFWRMIWEHNSTIIVMLTKLRELGREKCEQYWPVERSQRYQYFVVYPVAEYSMPQYILREFKVTDARDGQSRTVRQFQFTDWPEEGVPKIGEVFIDFCHQVHKTKEQFGQEGPITVHCSTGVGRTGAFIALSVVLERLRYEGVIDIFQAVKLLRTQRPSMVQTLDQYQFLYFAALEYLNSFDEYNNS